MSALNELGRWCILPSLWQCHTGACWWKAKARLSKRIIFTLILLTFSSLYVMDRTSLGLSKLTQENTWDLWGGRICPHSGGWRFWSSRSLFAATIFHSLWSFYFFPFLPVLFLLSSGSEKSRGAVHRSMSQPEASSSSYDSEWEKIRSTYTDTHS